MKPTIEVFLAILWTSLYRSKPFEDNQEGGKRAAGLRIAVRLRSDIRRLEM